MRRNLIKPLLLVLFASFLFACASNRPELLTFEYLPSDFQVDYQEKGANIYVINKQDELDKAFKELQMKPQTEIDFNFFFQNNTLILVYGGMQRSTGYKLSIESITLQKGKLMVLSELHTPGEGCFTGDMITYPMQLVAIKKIKVDSYTSDMQVVPKACK